MHHLKAWRRRGGGGGGIKTFALFKIFGTVYAFDDDYCEHRSLWISVSKTAATKCNLVLLETARFFWESKKKYDLHFILALVKLF